MSRYLNYEFTRLYNLIRFIEDDIRNKNFISAHNFFNTAINLANDMAVDMDKQTEKIKEEFSDFCTRLRVAGKVLGVKGF